MFNGVMYKSVVLIWFSVFYGTYSTNIVDYMSTHLDVTYTVLDNLAGRDENNFQFSGQIVLNNTGSEHIGSDWKIYFCSIRLMESQVLINLSIAASGVELGDSGVRVYHINGCLHRLAPIPGEFRGLDPGAAITLPFWAAAWVVQRTDVMPRWTVTNSDSTGVVKVIESTASEDLAFVSDFTSEKQWKRTRDDQYHPMKTHERYEWSMGKSRDLGHAPNPILPTPVYADLSSDQHLQITAARGWVVVYQNSHIEKEALFLAASMGVQAVPWNQMPTTNYITMQIVPAISTNEEAYECHVTGDSVNITGSSAAGVFYGVQTLITLREHPEGIPQGVIRDHPRFPYRGMHLDVSRNFHAKADVLQLLDVMAMYKLNKFHFHLSDDEGWRLEIPGIPEATEVGSKRCFDLTERTCIIPQLGSGPDTDTSGSGRYSAEDYRDILQYAADRHIEVIPEFDMPGHSHAIIKAMEARYAAYANTNMTAATEYLLSDPGDTSQYLSIQLFKDNTINPCMESTYNFVRHLVKQLKSMHQDIQPLKVFHFGGDEVGAKAWEGSPMCQQHLQNNPGDSSLGIELQKYFAIRVAQIVADEGLDLAGWEDGLGDHNIPFNRSELPNDNVYMYAWNNIWEWGGGDKAYIFANNDYKVILSHATHLYFDHPQEPDPEERGFYWATRYTDMYKTFSYMAHDVYDNIHTTSMGEPLDRSEFCSSDDKCIPLLENKRHNVIGLQGHLWSETVRTKGQLHSMVFPRLLALAERAWHKAPWEETQDSTIRDADWEGFANTLGYRELARLSKIGIRYYIPPPGARIRGGVLEMNNMCPGLNMQYSVDSGVTWLDYSPGVTMDTATGVLARTSSTDGKYHSRVVMVTMETVTSAADWLTYSVTSLLMLSSFVYFL